MNSLDDLLKYAYSAIENSGWEDARKHLDEAEKIDGKNAYVYLGNLLVDFKLTDETYLSVCLRPFEDNKNFKYAIKYGDESLTLRLKSYLLESKGARKKAECKNKNKRRMILSYAAFGMAAIVTIISLILLNNSKLDYGAFGNSAISTNDNTYEAKQKRAYALLERKEYDKAYELLSEIGNTQAIIENKYARAKELIVINEYEAAYALLEEIGANEEINKNKHDRAMVLLDTHNYSAAYDLLQELGDFERINTSLLDRTAELIRDEEYEKAYALITEDGYGHFSDSSEKEKRDEMINMISADYFQSIFASVEKQFSETKKEKVVVQFGEYEQDGNQSNGPEPIEWDVIEISGGHILLVSSRILEYKPFCLSASSISWETSSIRTWLNEDFKNEAFTALECSIIGTFLSKEPHVEDKVFLLDEKEIQHYYPMSWDKRCYTTVYCDRKIFDNHETYLSKYGFKYWTRTTNSEQNNAQGVYEYFYYTDGTKALGVRPAIWITPQATSQIIKAPRLYSGDHVSFGHYYQTYGNADSEPIIWHVLDTNDGKALLLSVSVLDCQQYNETSGPTTWENCSLRKWLNNVFYNNAFSENEREQIISITVEQSENVDYIVSSSGKEATDKIFILGIEDAKRYFQNDSTAALASLTSYAWGQGARDSGRNGECPYWLRSPGMNNNYAAIMSSETLDFADGSWHTNYKIDTVGNEVTTNNLGVRPALWVSIDDLEIILNQ